MKSFRNTISYIFVDVGDNHSDTKLQMTSRAFLRQNLEVTPVMIEYELLSVVPFILLYTVTQIFESVSKDGVQVD